MRHLLQVITDMTAGADTLLVMEAHTSSRLTGFLLSDFLDPSLHLVMSL